MPSLAYAKDLSRGYAAGPMCGPIPCTEIPNCFQAQACVSSCGPGVLQNCPNNQGFIPGFTPTLNYLQGGSQDVGNRVAKGAGAIGQGVSDAWKSTLDALKSSLGALTAPCGWASKVPGINQIPCWVTYMLIALGLVVLVKH